MRRTPGFVLVLPCLFSLCLPDASLQAAADPGSPPARVTLSIGAQELSIRGATPGGRIAWFGVEREVDPDFSVARRARQGVVVAGTDGAARLILDPPPSARAFWVVVDVQSGGFATGAPDGYLLNRLDRGKTPARGEADPTGEADRLVETRQQIEGLMVRPGLGAWRFSGGEGGPDDDDGKHDGALRMSLAKFHPIGTSPAAPGKIGGEDLWFVIDPVAMDLSILKGGVAQ